MPDFRDEILYFHLCIFEFLGQLLQGKSVKIGENQDKLG